MIKIFNYYKVRSSLVGERNCTLKERPCKLYKNGGRWLV